MQISDKKNEATNELQTTATYNDDTRHTYTWNTKRTQKKAPEH